MILTLPPGMPGETGSPAAAIDTERLSIVVVDDDADVRKALGRLLKSLGHEVRTVGSAEEFEAQPADADCLILDVRMPGLNGPELRERLRMRGSSTPIVFITGDGDGGPATALAKPFDDAELIAAIAQAVRTARDGR